MHDELLDADGDIPGGIQVGYLRDGRGGPLVLAAVDLRGLPRVDHVVVLARHLELQLELRGVGDLHDRGVVLDPVAGLGVDGFYDPGKGRPDGGGIHALLEVAHRLVGLRDRQVLDPLVEGPGAHHVHPVPGHLGDLLIDLGEPQLVLQVPDVQPRQDVAFRHLLHGGHVDLFDPTRLLEVEGHGTNGCHFRGPLHRFRNVPPLHGVGNGAGGRRGLG